jgi:type I restriction enzyme S subunit
MKNGLPIKPLQSLCDDFKQDIVDGPFGSELQRKDYITQGVPVLKIQNVKPFGIELKKMDYVSTAKFQELRRHSYRRGDIVLTKLGRPLGASAIVEDTDEGLIVADLVRIRAQRINTRYLCYHLNSQRTNDFINSMQKGTTRPRVTLSVVRELPIFVPSSAEQERIVGILDEAFEGIATAKANAEKNLQNARALFESHLQSVFTQRGNGWVDSSVGEVIRFIDYRGKTPAKTSSGVRLITAKNVKMGYLQETPMEFIASANYRGWMTRGIPQRGDVLFTTEAPLANVAQLDTNEKAAFAQRIIIMQPNKSRLDSTFLKYLLLSAPVQQRIRAKGTGATVQGIKASLLKLIEISFPKTLPEQERIVEKLDALGEETQRLASLYGQKLAALEALKKSLLHQAFAGRL